MKSNNKGKMVACAALVAATWLVGAQAVSAATYTFKQGVNGYTGASSTYTEYQGDGAQAFNYGASTRMLIYTPLGQGVPQKTGFLMFDLSSIEEPVVVNSASMSITVAGDPSRPSDFNLNCYIYPILRSGLDFGSGNASVDTGALTFNSAAYNTVGWGNSNTGNYGPVAGEDYGSTAIGSFTLTGANAATAVVNFSLDSATVASWINNPSSNYGFVIVADATAQGGSQLVIYTGNEGIPFRPELTIDAQAVPEPASMALLGLGAVAFLIRKRMSARQGLSS